MYSIQGIIRKNVNNASSMFERLAYVGSNYANYNTNGYKAVRFEQMLSEDGYVSGVVRTDYKNGALKMTSNPYDVAIDGEGFIPIVSPDGEVAYTRDGSFKRGKDGYLMTNDNWIVGAGIKLPANVYKFQIKPDGSVYTYESALDKEGKCHGTIPLVQFDCNEGLEADTNGNRVWQTEESGEPKLVKNHDYIKQNFIERSNTDIYASVNDMLRLNASMLASMSIVKMTDDMYNKSINIREG
ncbi:flagellar hook basal-body protein [bacterium]|nr:flagellar hook basal-body protein [bacterium]